MSLTRATFEAVKFLLAAFAVIAMLFIALSVADHYRDARAFPPTPASHVRGHR